MKYSYISLEMNAQNFFRLFYIIVLHKISFLCVSILIFAMHFCLQQLCSLSSLLYGLVVSVSIYDVIDPGSILGVAIFPGIL